MKVTETLTEGLKREYQVTLAVTDLLSRVDTEIEALKGRVQINGFRPGKVPTGHLKRLYGRSVMGDVLQNAVNDANQKIVEDNKLRLAQEPQIKLPEDKDAIEAIFDGKADLSYSVALEVLPSFEIQDFSGLSVVKDVAEVPEKDVEEEIERLAKMNRSYADKGDKAKVAKDDRVTIDFVGSIDGVPFEGGKGSDTKLVIGSDQFIAGFEDGLVGAKVGDTRTVKATFPAEYGRTDLAGKEASFEVTVKEIEAPNETKIDDELAKALGLDTLDNLRKAVREQAGRALETASRVRLKKRLLDQIDTQYSFDLPPTMLEQEFQNVWASVMADMQGSGKTFADDDTTEEDAKAEYRKIAERRVRLGLVLAEIGEKAEVKIADEEVTQALIARARQFPGQEQAVWDFYRKNPQALAELRAPIFEEKVIDHILSKASVTENKISKDDLLSEEEEESVAGKAKAKKKAAPKKKAE
jgi:trigger factor